MIKNPPANAGESREEFNPWVRKILWTRKGQHTPVFLPGKFHDRAAWQAAVHGITKSYIWDFPGGPVVKNPPSNAGDVSLIPDRETKILTCHRATEPACHN